MDRKILILGASGFLGGVLYDKLTDVSCRATVYGTYNTNRDDKLVKLDVLNRESVDRVISSINPDIVLWTIYDMPIEDKLTDIGIENVLSAIGSNCTFVFLSTKVFNGGKGGYSECDKPDYTKQNNHLDRYAFAKISAEEKVMRHTNHIIVRPGVIYGKDGNNQWDLRMSRMIKSITNNECIKLSKNKISTWGDVDFIAESIIYILKKSFRGIIHLGNNEKESGYSMNIKIAQSLGLDTNLIIPIEDDFADNSYDLSKQWKVLSS